MSVYRSGLCTGGGGVGPVTFGDWGSEGVVASSEAFGAYRRYCEAFVVSASLFGGTFGCGSTGLAERGSIGGNVGEGGFGGGVDVFGRECGVDGCRGGEQGVVNDVGVSGDSSLGLVRRRCFDSFGLCEHERVRVFGVCGRDVGCGRVERSDKVGVLGESGGSTGEEIRRGDVCAVLCAGGGSVVIPEGGLTAGEESVVVDEEEKKKVEGVFPSVGVKSGAVPLTGSCVGVGGPNLERNKVWRQERKEKKKLNQARGFDSRKSVRGDACSWRKPVVPRELDVSWVARKNAENELATLKAKKDLEYQQARDVDAESRKRRAALMKSTERDKVAVEKAFSTLKATGNVPGFCATVVDGSELPSLSGGSGSPHDSISPDSSASMHEFRLVQKKNLDLEAEVVALKAQLKLGRVERGDGTVYSLNSKGTLDDDLKAKFKEMEDSFHEVDVSQRVFDPDHHVFVKKISVDGGEYTYY